MRTLDRYLAGRLTAHFALTLAALVTVFSMTALMEELREVGTGTYGFRQALWHVALTAPTDAYGLFPAAALIGTVTALGALAGASEILAVWASGISKARFTWSIMRWALGLMAAVAAGGEFIAAPLAQRAGAERSAALSGGRGFGTGRGVWVRDGATFIHIGTATVTGELQDVFIYEFDEQHRLQRFSHAADAVYARKRWTLHHLVEQEIGAEGVAAQLVASRPWEVRLTRKQLRALLLPPQALSLAQLYESIDSLREREQDARRYEQAFWRRLTMPLATGVMVLLAIPFVLTAPPRTPLGLRLVIAVFAGIGFQLLDGIVGDLGFGAGIPPSLSAAFTPLIGALVATLWMRRAH